MYAGLSGQSESPENEHSEVIGENLYVAEAQRSVVDKWRLSSMKIASRSAHPVSHALCAPCLPGIHTREAAGAWRSTWTLRQSPSSSPCRMLVPRSRPFTHLEQILKVKRSGSKTYAVLTGICPRACIDSGGSTSLGDDKKELKDDYDDYRKAAPMPAARTATRTSSVTSRTWWISTPLPCLSYSCCITLAS